METVGDTKSEPRGAAAAMAAFSKPAGRSAAEIRACTKWDRQKSKKRGQLRSARPRPMAI